MGNNHFIHESAIYQLIALHGINTPVYSTIKSESDIPNLPFQDGEPVVIKGLGKDLWHKSDEGALHFVNYSEKNIQQTFNTIKANLIGKYDLIEVLICKKIFFKSATALPTEAFISIQNDNSYGLTISVGIGGVYTENWASELTAGILMWPVSLITPKLALEEFKQHLIGKIWFGKLRQSKPLTTEDIILELLTQLWNLAEEIEQKNIKLLEINPMVLDSTGFPIALDGVGLYGDTPKKISKQSPLKSSALLNPKTIAIAGVSDKPGSFGTRILDNLINSELSKNQIRVIKPGISVFRGVECYGDLQKLQQNPVDVLIIALPAKVTVATLRELCEQGVGADIVFLVAGGLGDGADKNGLGRKLSKFIESRRDLGLWTPAIIGPNSLGIVLSPLKISTLFISRNRLPVNFHKNGNIGFISQSGAFFITRLSNSPELPIKFGFCIGNQMDKKASDIIKTMSEDKDLKIFSVYIEGFSDGDAIKFTETAKSIINEGKKVILYKGGRSDEGMEAAAGHTGAMAANYDLQKNLFKNAGIIVTERFDEFTTLLKWFSTYPDYQKPKKVAVISNAGYETVGSADLLGADKKTGQPNLLMPLSDKNRKKLEIVIEKNGLKGLVSATNPLDITPMAGDKAYLDSIKCMAETDADTVVLCIIPLADMLQVFNQEKVNAFISELKEIIQTTKKAIGVVVDSGDVYDQYRKMIALSGIPVFQSIEDLFKPLVMFP
jgi:acyl-CoA synthetase (NDP forming)